MFRARRLTTAILIVTLLGALALAAVSPPRAAAQDNLLVNGGMEGGYSPQDGIPQLQMPAGWRAWWIEGGGAEWANLRPEFSTSSASAGYVERVHSGDRAMRYFKGWATFTAGAYQTVTVTPGANYEFSAWGHLWSCLRWNDCFEGRESEGLPPRVWSTNDTGKMHMKVGIDPTGGTDPFSGNVVWSPEAPAADNYVQFTVRAAAQADRLTVFLYASQDYPAENQAAYWDDAVLTGAGAGAVSSGGDGGSTGSVSIGVAVIPTYPPREDGRVIHTVRAGETLGGIAVAYGLQGAQVIRDLNNLTSDIIGPGQELLVGQVEAAAPAEGEAAADAGGGGVGASLADEGEPGEATPDPASIAATEVAMAPPTTGEVCVRVFGDNNQNRVFDSAERMLGGSTVTVKQGSEALASYRTDGMNEPHCFTLDPGDYMLETAPPRAYSVTTSAALAVRVEVGAAQQVDVGVARGLPASEGAASGAPTPAARAEPAGGSGLTDLLAQYAGVIVLGVALLVAAAWLIWSRVRR